MGVDGSEWVCLGMECGDGITALDWSGMSRRSSQSEGGSGTQAMAVSAKAEACHAGRGRQRRMSTLCRFTHSVLGESGDCIAALHMGVEGIGWEPPGMECGDEITALDSSGACHTIGDARRRKRVAQARVAG
jgi:hypothetical protein